MSSEATALAAPAALLSDSSATLSSKLDEALTAISTLTARVQHLESRVGQVAAASASISLRVAALGMAGGTAAPAARPAPAARAAGSGQRGRNSGRGGRGGAAAARAAPADALSATSAGAAAAGSSLDLSAFAAAFGGGLPSAADGNLLDQPMHQMLMMPQPGAGWAASAWGLPAAVPPPPQNPPPPQQQQQALLPPWSQAEDETLIAALQASDAAGKTRTATFEHATQLLPGRSAGAIKSHVHLLVTTGRLNQARRGWSAAEDQALLLAIQQGDAAGTPRSDTYAAILPTLPGRSLAAVAGHGRRLLSAAAGGPGGFYAAGGGSGEVEGQEEDEEEDEEEAEALLVSGSKRRNNSAAGSGGGGALAKRLAHGDDEAAYNPSAGGTVAEHGLVEHGLFGTAGAAHDGYGGGSAAASPHPAAQ